MKKQLLKSVMCLSLSAAMIFAEAPLAMAAEAPVAVTEEGDSVDAAGAKIVSYTSIQAPTGLGYDAVNEMVFWNSVPMATSYHVSIKNTLTGEVKENKVSDPNVNIADYDAGSYIVSVMALDTTGVYLGVANIPNNLESSGPYYDRPDVATTYENLADGTLNFYFYPASTPVEMALSIPEKANERTTKTNITSVVFKEMQEGKMIFVVPNAPKLLEGETLVWEYSNNPEFHSNSKLGKMALSMLQKENINEEFVLSTSMFAAGETCYVRARVESEKYNPGNMTSDELEKQKFGIYTPVVSCVVPKAVLHNVNTTVSGSKIVLNPTLSAGDVTGYQYAKKIGKSWVTIAKQTGNSYTDKGLTSNKAYKYRVRGYSYNKYTGKTTYTDYKYVNATTWGASLKVKSSASSSSSVKLSWNKVTGASGYEIYRKNSDSRGMNATESWYDDSFASYDLIKTITKSKTTSYTDKKLSSGMSYDYIVRAYRTSGKDKSYISGSTSIRLASDGFSLEKSYYTSSGSYKVEWKKMTGIKGYKVERYNTTTSNYDYVKKLSKTATSYTFPSVVPGQESVKYRVRPYTSSMNYEGATVTVESRLATVKNVRAIATPEGIQVTWSPVEGADYYSVYRYFDNDYVYDTKLKAYAYRGRAEQVCDAAVDMNNYYPELGDYFSQSSVGTYKDKKIRTTSVLDKTVTYTKTVVDITGNKVPALDAAGQPVKNAKGEPVYQVEEAIWNKGPELGVTYNYVVIAYAKAPNGLVTSSEATSVYSSKQASAMMTNKVVKKVSKITSVKSKKTGEATISFKKVSGVSGYAIYRATSKKGTYVRVGTSTKTSYTDMGLKSGKTYYYKVAAYGSSEAKEYIYSAKTAYKSVKVK